MDAPFDSDWEIWVLGNQLDKYEGKRVTRIFEIHDNLTEHDESYPQWLVSQGIRLVVGKKFPIQAENVEIYPEQEVRDLFGGGLSSSPAYMIGMAILEGYKEIAIYGIDMAVEDHEYFKQRPDMYAWIGYAKGKGIKVTIADRSPLFKPNYTEGTDWGNADEYTEMAEIHQSKIDGYEQQKREIDVLIHTHNGAKQVYERLAKVARSGTKVSITDSAIVR